MRKKSERVLILLEKGPVLKQERNRARKITRGIQGFGSMNCRWIQESKDEFNPSSSDHCGRSNSQYECYGDEADEILEGGNWSSSSDVGVVDFQKNNILEGEKLMKMNVAVEMRGAKIWKNLWWLRRPGGLKFSCRKKVIHLFYSYSILPAPCHYPLHQARAASTP